MTCESRRDDVERSIAGKLNDVFAKVRLYGFDSLRLETFIQTHLLGQH